MCSAGLKVRNFQLRTESSRQRRIGGVATTSRSTKNAENPH